MPDDAALGTLEHSIQSRPLSEGVSALLLATFATRDCIVKQDIAVVPELLDDLLGVVGRSQESGPLCLAESTQVTPMHQM